MNLNLDGWELVIKDLKSAYVHKLFWIFFQIRLYNPDLFSAVSYIFMVSPVI